MRDLKIIKMSQPVILVINQVVRRPFYQAS